MLALCGSLDASGSLDANVAEFVLRYGGWWKRIPRTERKKYECEDRKL